MLDTSDLETRGWTDESQDGMTQCRAALSTHYGPAEAERWLTTPHQLLDGRTAAFTIGAGQTQRVLDIIRTLDTSAATWTHGQGAAS